MSGSTISTTINNPVEIGAAPGGSYPNVSTYASPLTITNTGAVSPPAYSYGAALFLYDAAGTVINHGTLTGPVSFFSVPAVQGSGGSLFNDGLIVSNGDGGAGIRLNGGTITNAGTIIGGPADGGSGSGIHASAGIFGGDAVTNTGTIAGSEGYGIFQVQYTKNYGTILGGVGADVASGETLINDGLVEGVDHAQAGFGVHLSGSLENSGTIKDGVSLTNGNLVNHGTIIGGTLLGGGAYGVELDGGSFVNYGLVRSDSNPVSESAAVTDAGGYLKNLGTIYGPIYLSNYVGGTDPAEVSTFINEGLVKGYIKSSGGTFKNYGDVTGTLIYRPSQSVSNASPAALLQNYGTLDGGVEVTAGTLINAGLIGTTYYGPSVYFQSSEYSPAGRLVVDPGASFESSVIDYYSTFDLELAEAPEPATGTLDMHPRNNDGFVGVGTIIFDNGASWLLGGTTDELAAGEVITGFATTDTLDLEGFTATTETYVSGAGLELSNGTTTETLDIAGSFSTSSFLVTDTTTGTEIELLCYLRGTRIATPAGDIPIEAFAIGDTVITRFSGYRRIKWIGRQSFSARFIENNRAQIPVRIHAGALGPNLPKRDLFVSPGHAMLLGEALILASRLVNGVTVTQDVPPDEIHYYQLEFETHDCILAEGAWSESFCDYAGLRNQFHNSNEFWRLHPNHLTPTEHLLCASRPEHGPALDSALRPVATRAAALARPGPLQGWIDEIAANGTIRGWARDLANPHLPILLEIRESGRPLGAILACDPREDLATKKFGASAFTFAGKSLSPRARRNVTIHRAADGAPLPMAPHCQTGLRIGRVLKSFETLTQAA